MAVIYVTTNRKEDSLYDLLSALFSRLTLNKKSEIITGRPTSEQNLVQKTKAFERHLNSTNYRGTRWMMRSAMTNASSKRAVCYCSETITIRLLPIYFLFRLNVGLIIELVVHKHYLVGYFILPSIFIFKLCK